MSRAADVLIVHARPWSDGAPVVGADTVALADGRIVAVGPHAVVEPLADSGTRVLDAAGATVTPGLTDAHLHLVAWAKSLGEADLVGASSRAECLERVRRFALARPGDAVLIGRGFDANGWREPPDRAALDAVTGPRPALLHSKDYHALWVNSAALAAAAVTRATPDPAGGRFARDGAGEPNGMVIEHAVRAFAGLGAQADAAADLDGLVTRAIRMLHAAGITAVHDFEDATAAARLRAHAAAGGPPLRVLSHLAHRELDDAIARGVRSGTGDDVFRVGAVKLFADGTLGSRTAAMLEPYDGTDGCGMELMSRDELRATVARALAAGIAVAVHAIGDRACRHVLDAFEAAGADRARPALPSRIEHAQIVHPDDRARFGQLGIVASVQPQHFVTDIPLARRGWGSRIDHAYPWRSLAAAGASLAFGSDAPVEPPDSAAALAAAVTRRPPDPAADTFGLDERLGMDQALRAYTEVPARLAGAWPATGRLAPGSFADVVIWDRDLHAADAVGLRGASARWTLWAGRPVHAPRESSPGGSGGEWVRSVEA